MNLEWRWKVLGLDPSHRPGRYIYYSFVCITTTGYRDIAPLSQSARLFSILESVIGQLYLAILIARLVSIEVAQSMMGGRPE